MNGKKNICNIESKSEKPKLRTKIKRKIHWILTVFSGLFSLPKWRKWLQRVL